MRSNRHIRRLEKRLEDLAWRGLHDAVIEATTVSMQATLAAGGTVTIEGDPMPMTRYWRVLRQNVSDKALGLDQVPA